MKRRVCSVYLMTLAVSVAAPQSNALAQSPGGPGGFGMVQEERKLVKVFDKNGDKRLNAAERKAAYDSLVAESASGGGRRGFGGRGRGGPGGMTTAAVVPGPRLSPSDAKALPKAKTYDLDAVRTFFLEFEDANWEKELMLFKDTDIDMLATVKVDGRTFQDVGVRFRGMSSFMFVPEGQKHSINLALAAVRDTQQLGGYHTLNLLNSHEDASWLHSILYAQIAKAYIPAPMSNFARVAINGESWGVYVNSQQYGKDFLRDFFGTTDGARWKVPGSPFGRGGLEYNGDDPKTYRSAFEIKSKDTPKAWAALIALTKVLNTTPAAQLEAALAPILDVDGALKFLALDVALVNGDGYWTRASDYSIYQDPKGVFHIIPQDVNETFSTGGGMGGPGGPFGGRGMPDSATIAAFMRGRGGDTAGFAGRGGPPGGGMPPGGMPPGGGPGGPGGGRGGMVRGGVELDPLVGLTDATKPLRSKLLAVPAFRAKYLAYVRDIATKGLDWKTLGPIVTRAQAMIDADVKRDTRKLETYEDFQKSAAVLKDFADKRRAFLLAWRETP